MIGQFILDQFAQSPTIEYNELVARCESVDCVEDALRLNLIVENDDLTLSLPTTSNNMSVNQISKDLIDGIETLINATIKISTMAEGSEKDAESRKIAQIKRAIVRSLKL